MKNKSKILSICLGLVLALGVTACDEISDLLDEGTGSEDTTETDTGSEGSGGDTGDGSEQGKEKEEDNVLVTSLTFNASSYSLEVGGSTPYSVSVEPDDATNKGYSISFYTAETHVVTTTIATTSEDNTSIIGLSAGECYIVATALDGSGVYGYASVAVNAKETPIEHLILSQDEITVYAGASFTISSLEGSDVVVTPDPVNADNPAWTIKEESTSYLTVSTRGTDNSYTVEASEEGAGKTTSLVLTAEAVSEVTATLTVHISEVVADTHPVTGITLTKDGTSISELTLTSGDELTIGAVDSDADIIVEISPSDADEVGFTVSSDNSDIVTISDPDNDTGIVTVTALDNTSWDKDKEATIKVTTLGKDASGTTLEATLKVVVPRPEEYVNNLEVTPKSISLVTNEEILLTSLDGFSVTIYNQYNEVMNGVDWTAEVTSGTEYLELSGSTSIDYSIKALSAGSATITINAYGTQISDTIAVSITDKVYEVTSIEMDANQYDLGYGLGGETSEEYPASIDLAQHVKYINNEADGGLASSSQYGVTAKITSGESYITLSGTEVTAIGVGSATVTLTSITNTQASVVANIVVTDITDYTPTGITCSTTSFTVSNGSTTTLSDAITGVSVVPAYASQEYVVMVASGSENYLSISEGVLSATNNTNSDVEGTLLVYPLYNEVAYTSVTPASITVTIKTDYVPVTSVTISPETLSLTVGGETDTVTATVYPDNATYKDTITWDSSVPSVATINDGVVTPLSAGTTVITATCDGIKSNECTVTVAAAKEAFTSYTLVVELLDSSGNLFPLIQEGEQYGVYVQSAYDSWGHDDSDLQNGHKMTNNGDGTYSYTFASAQEVGEYDTNVYVGNGSIDWNHKIDNFNIIISGDEEGAYVADVHETKLASEYSSWSDIFPTHSGTTNFYVVIFEDQNNLSSSTLTSTYVKAAAGMNTGFDSHNFFTSGSECDAATGTNAKNGSSQPYIYNSEVAVAEAENKTNYWVTFYDGSSGWTNKIEVAYYMGDIPDCESGYAVFSLVVNTKETTYSPWAATSGVTGISSGWVTGVESIDAFFSTYVTGIVN